MNEESAKEEADAPGESVSDNAFYPSRSVARSSSVM